MNRWISGRWRLIKHLMLTTMVLFDVLIAFALFKVNLTTMPSDAAVAAALDFIGVIICTVLFVSSIEDSLDSDGINLSMMMILYLAGVLMTSGALSWTINGFVNLIFLNQFLCFLCYFTPIVLILEYDLFSCHILGIKWRDMKYHKPISLSLAAIGTILILINYKTHAFFFIDEMGIYHRSPGFGKSNIIPILLFVVILITIIRSDAERNKKILTIIYSVFPILVCAFQSLTFGFPFMEMAVLITILMAYSNIYRQKSVELMHQQNEILKYQTDVMISQIQPHFIFNVLGSIQELCMMDAKQAAIITFKFAKYLRTNINSVKEDSKIPFYKELDHIRIYLELEQMRFEDVEMVIGTIEADEFLVPNLSIQPIVENAIKHGIMSREEGGRVTISEKEYDHEHVIIVTDDGMGFDPTKKKNDGKVHVGVENVSNRLKIMVDGSLEIRSKRGEGTTCLIHIPK